MAHAEIRGRQGIILRNDAEKIVGGLRADLREIEAGRSRFTGIWKTFTDTPQAGRDQAG